MTAPFLTLSQTQTMLRDFDRTRKAVAGYSPEDVARAWRDLKRWIGPADFGSTPAATVQKRFARFGDAVDRQDMDLIVPYWDLCERWLFCLSPEPVHSEQKEAA